MQNWIKNIFGKREEPKVPNGWRLTTSDLMNELREGKRKSVESFELKWGREYERHLIPKNYRFPRQGDLYASLIDQEINFMTDWAAPFTGSGQSILFKGEQIWIDTKPEDEKPIGSSALPVDYRILEERMVTEQDRKSGKYAGFYFYFSTVDLNEKFRLLKTEFKKVKYE